MPSTTPARLFARGSWPEARRIADVLRNETTGGLLLLACTVLALVWANLPGGTYEDVRQFHLGPAALHLDLSVEHWAADGLLAVFFFVAGLELKKEFVAGDLRDPRAAALPIAAAVGGMAVPALFYVLVNVLHPDAVEGALVGWAIPSATDIAFALGILAVVGSRLPSALRTFLLTLAVVDDLLGITVIAVFYTERVQWLPLLLGLVTLALFAVAVQRRVRTWWILLPLALATWGLVHASGIHATVAGVLLGLVVPVLRSEANGGPEAGPGLSEHFAHRWQPISTGFAVPVFALMSAGVAIGGVSGLVEAVQDPVALGVVAGLVLGKPVGIVLTTFLVARLTRAELDESLHPVDVLGMAMLAGMGFTVSLLIGSLAFGEGSPAGQHVTLGVLIGSAVSAALAAVVLSRRNAVYRRIEAEEGVDADGNGVPDVYER
ncbi:sodium/proton antiporter (NhaA family) [Kineococcus rhizosphaerae]|uniref:Na(+)/H(+) antiporter NhaA n=1 Tax=Kineococcus rhizosphaerae TaxID=559628 RepID=A0A2T0R2Y6_9ACTN|nr:Na+/H+ antiporter NhaA [Kineococcus rhizosphaerae]PRY14145.1 sodium/proton antiporter (NhaA family) [Kineococcus rhizosphaerae]